MDNMNRIEALSEAISILYQANGRNCCEWAENRVRNAIYYLKPQQSALCVEQFPPEPPPLCSKCERPGCNGECRIRVEL